MGSDNSHDPDAKRKMSSVSNPSDRDHYDHSDTVTSISSINSSLVYDTIGSTQVVFSLMIDFVDLEHVEVFP